ncbi:hypothetical protein EVAR_85281_1 [Eumeta japonica]|uniref:Uncharacterized protein n=1 Tax=Eumeta variegata TaxID=151549 RepID=A0A4C1V6W5_EUMVA|nr:hypothetical protein EVAR_85281_1 [Eumeta japonica]
MGFQFVKCGITKTKKQKPGQEPVGPCPVYGSEPVSTNKCSTDEKKLNREKTSLKVAGVERNIVPSSITTAHRCGARAPEPCLCAERRDLLTSRRRIVQQEQPLYLLNSARYYFSSHLVVCGRWLSSTRTHRLMEWKRNRSFRALARTLGSGGTRQNLSLYCGPCSSTILLRIERPEPQASSWFSVNDHRPDDNVWDNGLCCMRHREKVNRSGVLDRGAGAGADLVHDVLSFVKERTVLTSGRSVCKHNRPRVTNAG